GNLCRFGGGIHPPQHVLDDGGTGNNTDKNISVIHDGNEVLIHGSFHQGQHVGGHGNRLVIAAAGETGDGDIFTGVQIQTVNVLDSPQKIALADGPDILAVAAQHRNGGEPLVGPFFQRLTEGKVLVNEE